MTDQSKLQSGDTAPDFTLVNQDGETVQLADFKGQTVILYFYPKAMTSGCTLQANAFNDALDQLRDADAVVLGVSPDPVSDLEKFRQKEGLEFDLLSDEDHAVADQYGVWGPKKNFGREYEGIIRSQFIVGPDGTLQDVVYNVQAKQSLPKAMAVLN